MTAQERAAMLRGWDVSNRVPQNDEPVCRGEVWCGGELPCACDDSTAKTLDAWHDLSINLDEDEIPY